MALIGVSGKIGSGKDLFAQLFQKLDVLEQTEQKLGMPTALPLEIACTTLSSYQIGKFAHPLKQFAASLIGCTTDDLESQAFKKQVLPEEWNIGENEPMTVRELLIRIGNGCREVVHPNVWINEFINRYRANPVPMIVTDLRYPNEMEAIRNLGGVIVRIESNRSNPIDHISETALDDCDDFDFIICNHKDSTLEDFESAVAKVFHSIKNR
jgi:hypothetical protein